LHRLAFRGQNEAKWPQSVQYALSAFERDYAPISDMRGSAAYRMQVAKNLLTRYFHETGHPLRESRLVGRAAAFG
jgi:xanthine dehydrogenase iron-sulfur cluster and FAD-binding subunit A